MLAVPEGSVIDTGRQKIVYRQTLPGEFEGVLVQLGPRMLDPHGVTFYPLLSGLEAGDEIVTSGSFLVDAETRLNPAAGSIYLGGSSGGGSTPSKTVRPSARDGISLSGTRITGERSTSVPAAIAHAAMTQRPRRASTRQSTRAVGRLIG